MRYKRRHKAIETVQDPSAPQIRRYILSVREHTLAWQCVALCPGRQQHRQHCDRGASHRTFKRTRLLKTALDGRLRQETCPRNNSPVCRPQMPADRHFVWHSKGLSNMCGSRYVLSLLALSLLCARNAFAQWPQSPTTQPEEVTAPDPITCLCRSATLPRAPDAPIRLLPCTPRPSVASYFAITPAKANWCPSNQRLPLDNKQSLCIII